VLKIISTCRQLDERAAQIYAQLGAVSSDSELAAFWGQMSRDEAEHLAYWKSLEHVAQNGALPQFFDDPTTTLAELRSHLSKLDTLLAQSRVAREPLQAFLVASGLELYLLYPALEALWHFAEEVLGISGSPAAAYETHIDGLLSAERRFGEPTLMLELFSETIRRLWVQNRRLAIDSQTDALTGLTNRRSLLVGMGALGRLAQRAGGTVAVLMVDVDDFKQVNDRHGHQRGDQVLARIARAVRQAMRRSDVVARFGGEEFLIFLPELRPALLSELAEKVRTSILGIADEVAGATVSVGGAAVRIEGDVDAALQRLIARADDSLREAKARGKNASVIAAP
jgi:diguanylate cyclase (GGDEF)-like protein